MLTVMGWLCLHYKHRFFIARISTINPKSIHIGIAFSFFGRYKPCRKIVMLYLYASAFCGLFLPKEYRMKEKMPAWNFGSRRKKKHSWSSLQRNAVLMCLNIGSVLQNRFLSLACITFYVAKLLHQCCYPATDKTVNSLYNRSKINLVFESCSKQKRSAICQVVQNCYHFCENSAVLLLTERK